MSKVFGDETTGEEVLEGMDLEGKIYLITGATSGLGAETARCLVNAGGKVILAIRNMKKGEALKDNILKENKQISEDKIRLMQVELASLKSIRRFAKRMINEDVRINGGILLNAGIMGCPKILTENEFEIQFGVNHLGHFLLTNLLLPLLESNARIVTVSSLAHMFAQIDFTDIMFQNREYNPMEAYGQSKTANILFTVELNKRLKNYDKTIRAYALNPGAILETELIRHMPPKMLENMKNNASAKLKFKSVQQGVATQIYALCSPHLQKDDEQQGGPYLEDCHFVTQYLDDSISAFDVGSGLKQYAISSQNASKLWSVSETLVGESFLSSDDE